MTRTEAYLEQIMKNNDLIPESTMFSTIEEIGSIWCEACNKGVSWKKYARHTTKKTQEEC